jgi:hypothetical protein
MHCFTLNSLWFHAWRDMLKQEYAERGSGMVLNTVYGVSKPKESPVDKTDQIPINRRTPLSRLRLSELELLIRRRWFEHATHVAYYPETLVRAVLLSGAQPQETVWQEAVTASLKAVLRELHELGLSRAETCMKMNELAICISDEVACAALDLVSAATLVEVANGTLLRVRDEMWSQGPNHTRGDGMARRKTS